jgi:hypothetical protein
MREPYRDIHTFSGPLRLESIALPLEVERDVPDWSGEEGRVIANPYAGLMIFADPRHATASFPRALRIKRYQCMLVLLEVRKLA